MRISDAGLSIIKEFEGFSTVPYRDGAGKMTIGFGHLIRRGELFVEIDEDAGIDLLRDDVRDAENAVDTLVTVPLNQNEFDSLCSFTFNLGAGSLRDSTLLRLLNARDFDGAAAQFTRWKYIGDAVSNGLSRRREMERALFTKPAAA